MLTRLILVTIMLLSLATAGIARVTPSHKPAKRTPAVTEQKLNVTAGYFYITDSGARDTEGNGLGVNLDYRLTPERPLYASIGYYGFSNTTSESGYDFDVKASIVPIMVSMRFQPEPSSRAYYGLGLGLVRYNVEISAAGETVSDSETDFGYQLFAGMSFGESMFGELKYLSGRRTGNSGLLFNIGGRF